MTKSPTRQPIQLTQRGEYVVTALGAASVMVGLWSIHIAMYVIGAGA